MNDSAVEEVQISPLHGKRVGTTVYIDGALQDQNDLIIRVPVDAAGINGSDEDPRRIRPMVFDFFKSAAHFRNYYTGMPDRFDG